MEKRIEVCIGTDRAKGLRVRLSLLIVDDNDLVLSEHYHSIFILPNTDLESTRAAVEAHLAMPYSDSKIPGAPWPKIPDAEWNDVEAHRAIIHKRAMIASMGIHEVDDGR